ncbi:MAG: hypothetical protein JW808_11265 [Victivallales bacterium]|nr:hypothetical protein [Victivallales bacterium]
MAGKTDSAMLGIFFLAAFYVAILPLKAQEPDSVQFLKMVRHPPGKSTWAILDGKVTHERKNASLCETPISFSVRFAPENTFAQLVIGGDEKYSIGQSHFSDKEKVTVIPSAMPKPSILSNFGLRPGDLTMSFLFWDFENELPHESFSTQQCRVFTLRSTEKNEHAKVHISVKYLFPLKVEWIRAGENKAYRMMEVSSFRKVNDLWVIDKLLLSGPGWRTKIEFSNCDAGLVENGIPENLFSHSNKSE